MVSIIIPTYNSEKTLADCLQSIVKQSYSDKEVLIIDGLSKDQTLTIAKRFATNFPYIKIASEKDQGIYDAMNKGIKQAKGEWLFFLGSDDKFYSYNTLSNVFKDNLSNIDIVYGNVYSPFFNGVYNGEYNVEKLLEKNICHQSIFFRKHVFKIVGNFNLKYKLHADWDHNLKWFVSKKIRKKYINSVIAYYGEGGTSSTHMEPFFHKIMQWKYVVYNKREISFINKLRIAKSEFLKAVRDRRRRDSLEIIVQFPYLFV